MAQLQGAPTLGRDFTDDPELLAQINRFIAAQPDEDKRLSAVLTFAHSSIPRADSLGLFIGPIIQSRDNLVAAGVKRWDAHAWAVLIHAGYGIGGAHAVGMGEMSILSDYKNG